jgi:acyl-CoA synthetase (AMP-forming)/AMP-acid ligase II
MYPAVHAAETPDKPALIMGRSGEVITYRQLDEASNRMAHYFRDLGLEPGDHVALMMENHPRYLAICWGAQRSGLYYTAISYRLQAAELAYILNDCQAQVFICSHGIRDVAAATIPETPDVRARLMVDGTVDGFDSFEAAVDRLPSTPIDNEVEGSDMLYSSGTTGRPKGIKPPITLAPMGSPNAMIPLTQGLFGIGPDSVYLSPAPMYHSAPLRFSMALTRLGSTVVVMEHFDPADALRLIEQYKVTHSQWVPTMFIRMLKLPEAERKKYDLSSLQIAIHAAAPCPVGIKEQMIEWWGPILHEYYAGTEGNGFVYTDSHDWLKHKGTVGKSLIGAVHICDEDGSELPVGEAGTIWFEGGAAFEYHDDPEKTAGSRDPRGRGWSTIGDVGYLDDEGYLYLTDRKAYMIISGGVNIYPQEAENVLALHPKVLDVAVFGVPNDEMGEEVKAVVQPVDMAQAGPELERELINYCREQLAHLKCPRTVDFRAELPRHPTGKLYKRLLKDEYWQGRTLTS